MRNTNARAPDCPRGAAGSQNLYRQTCGIKRAGDPQPAFTFVIPESFDPATDLPWCLRHRREDALYFVHLILTKTARGQADVSGFVRLHAAHLRRVMHFSEYHRVIEALLDHGAIERIGYSAGQQSFGYRLSERFIGDKHIRLPVSDPRLISRLPRFFWRAEADRLSRMKPVHHLLAEQQYRLQIDGDDARQILDSLPPKSNPYDVQGILVRDIECRKFQLNVGRYGRVSNNITSMKREVRKALRVNGEPLVSVDISCAQPALLAKIIKDKPRQRERQTKERKAEERSKQETQLPKGSIYDVHEILPSLPNDDLALFETLVLNGKFYAFLLDHLHRLGIPMERETLKRKFLADVIAKRKANRYGAEYPSQVEDIFRLLFPTVYGFIRDFNNDGWHHENLIRELQRQESKLVIETVAAALTTQYPDTFFLTLHDAIYTTSNHIPKVEQAFKNAFTQIGFQMTLKTA